MRQHSDTDRLSDAMARCAELAQRWAGVVYRSASVPYANRDDLLTGAGSRRAGARWNPPNSFATVYTSLEHDTASEEAFSHHRYYGFPIEQSLPRVLVAMQVVLSRVLNLTEQRSRRRLGITREEILTEDWRSQNGQGQEALTQAIGRVAWNSAWECEALLVPSSAHAGGVNLIVFPGNLVPPKSYLVIINRDQLPPPPD